MWNSIALQAVNTGHCAQSHPRSLLSPTARSSDSTALPCPLFSETWQLQGSGGNYLLAHADVNYRCQSRWTGMGGAEIRSRVWEILGFWADNSITRRRGKPSWVSLT